MALIAISRFQSMADHTPRAINIPHLLRLKIVKISVIKNLPSSRLSLNQLIEVLLHDIVTGYLNKYSFITYKIKVFMGRKNSHKLCTNYQKDAHKFRSRVKNVSRSTYCKVQTSGATQVAEGSTKCCDFSHQVL